MQRDEASPGAEPPEPYITGIRETNGVLWVAILVAGEDWRSGIEEDGRYSHGFTVVDEDRYRDTIVEAFDIHSGRLLGSIRMDQTVRGFVDDGLVSVSGFDSNAVPYVDIWELTLRPLERKE